MKRNHVFTHPVLGVVSLVIAFFVWLIVMNVSDPVRTKTFASIPVSVSNASYVESKGLSYKIADGFQNISVTVKSNTSIIERLSTSSIVANADLTQIIDFNSDPVMVPVTVQIPGVSTDSITANPRNIEISLEDMVSQDFVINTTAGDTSPANGYEIGSISATPEKLTLRGPKSLIERIDKVVAQVDVTGLKTDATLGTTIRVFDKNGDVLSDSRMNYLTPNIGFDDIRVRVTLDEVLSDVPIVAQSYGTPAEGYTVGDISVTPSTIQLVGSEDALDAFRADGGKIVIDSDSKAVDISGASSDQDINVKITDYLPADLRLAADLTDKVVVNVKILEQNTKSFEIETKNIRQDNLPDSLNAVFKESQLDVRVKGSDEKLARLSTDDISASVDLSGVKAGDVTLPVSISLPDGYELASQVTADLTISATEGDSKADSVNA
ncbi:CdaR family protein [Chordicoccus furentiruminis]|uniref:CdaR family protein n=1 Tax=Chordicoccus furentiruminis TaxID=2709410 RepID=UPI0023A7CD15|nr:CdaR family protein [Chordicoccus furentiruminis]